MIWDQFKFLLKCNDFMILLKEMESLQVITTKCLLRRQFKYNVNNADIIFMVNMSPARSPPWRRWWKTTQKRLLQLHDHIGQSWKTEDISHYSSLRKQGLDLLCIKEYTDVFWKKTNVASFSSISSMNENCEIICFKLKLP